MDAEVTEASEDIVGRLRGRTVQAGSGQHGIQRTAGEPGECFLAAGGRQREPVPQHSGEPGRGQQPGCTDLGEAAGHRRHVGEGFIDVEHDDARTRLHIISSRRPGR